MSRVISIRVDDDVANILERVGGNRSAYLAGLVRDACSDWQQAHDTLRVRDVSSAQILAVCDALNGTWLRIGVPGGVASSVALAIADAAECTDVLDKWDLDAGEWRALAELALSEDVGLALWVLAREFWRGNVEVERRLCA